MGLFDRLGKIGKKTCSICGTEVGPFSRKKLADGVVCSNCLALASPFWKVARGTTVAEVRDHLAYREQNREALKDFHPDVTIGSICCVRIDRQAGTFVLSADDEDNPDLLKLSQVRSVTYDVYEHDVTDTDSDGDSSHDHYEYTFYLVVDLDHPHLRRARFMINERPVINRGRRIKPRDAEAYYNGSKEIKGGLFSNKDDIERYMVWYADLQDMVAELKAAAEQSG